MTQGKPKPTSSLAEQEINRIEQEFNAFDENVKSLNIDNMNNARKIEVEPQTKMAQVDIEKSKDIYLKPDRVIGSREKFNEKWREQYNFSKEYVQFIAENKEIIGDMIECWTKKFPGVPCEFWKVPVNVPVWGPRYLAEQIKGCSYHRLVMKQNVASGSDGTGTYYGTMAADSLIQRLDASPVSSRKSIFMGATF